MSAPLILSSAEKVKSPPEPPIEPLLTCFECPPIDRFWVGGCGNLCKHEFAERVARAECRYRELLMYAQAVMPRAASRDRAERVRQLEYAIQMHLYRTTEERLALIARLAILREQEVTP